MQTNGKLAAAIDGGANGDTLSYTGRIAAVTVTLGNASTANGYTGSATDVGGGFKGIDIVVGGTALDSLYGRQVNNTWTFDGTNKYNDGTVGQDLVFSNFEKLFGGSLNDAFVFKNNATFTGSIDGGVGTDTLDYSNTGNTTSITVAITGSNAGSVNGTNFTSLENYKLTQNNDTFQMTSSSALVGGTIDAGGGNDTLDYTGDTAAVKANLSNNTATNTGGISNFENLTGGSGNDILVGNSGVNILIGGAGNDILIGEGGGDTFDSGAATTFLWVVTGKTPSPPATTI